MMFKGVQDVSSQKMICTTKDGAGLGGSWASSEGADRGGCFALWSCWGNTRNLSREHRSTVINLSVVYIYI